MERQQCLVCKPDIVEFIKDNIPSYRNYSDEDIMKIVEDHMRYGTYDELRKDGKLVACVRYNIDGIVAEILDLIIAPGYNSLYIMRRFILNGWSRFPYIKFLSYHRQYKRPQRKLAILSIRKLLRIKSSAGTDVKTS